MSGGYHYAARRLGPDDVRPLSMEDWVMSVMQDGQERLVRQISAALGPTGGHGVGSACSMLAKRGKLIFRRETREDRRVVHWYRLAERKG